MNIRPYAPHQVRSMTPFVKVALAVMITLGAYGVVQAGAVNANSSAALKEINQLSEQGNQATALEKVNAYIGANPKDAEALFMKGVILVEMGKRDEAVKAFTDLTAKYPNLPEPYNNLAVLYADQGQYDKARLALETAIKTHPSYATAHENLGDIYARLASEAYDKAFKLDTSNARAQSKLSMITSLFGGKSTTVAAAPVAAKAKPVAIKEPAKPVEATVLAAKPVEPAKVAPAKPEPIKPEPTKADAASQQEAVLQAVNAWAKAWSEQNVTQYLASYADNFKTPKGEARQSWENTRRQRINAPKNIEVQVSNPEVSVDSDTSASVRFYQTYRADGKPQSTSKTLVMTKVGNVWLISQERVGR
ncbi:MAG TPA: tetratricopeptide repeat protein [Methylophilus sp.]